MVAFHFQFNMSKPRLLRLIALLFGLYLLKPATATATATTTEDEIILEPEYKSSTENELAEDILSPVPHDKESNGTSTANETTTVSSSSEKQRCWGLNTCNPTLDEATVSPINEKNNTTTSSLNNSNMKKKTTPFVHVDLSAKHKMLPPEGYRVSAVVYPGEDGLSYFWKDESSIQQMPHIPFLECNAVGSTTAQLPFQFGTFRNFPCGAQPSSFSPATYPGQLLVCLSNVQLTVSGNNEETIIFHAGDVILLEDTSGKGHKVRACCSPDCPADEHRHTHEDMNVLLLTLPHPSGFPRKNTPTNHHHSSSHRHWNLFQRHPPAEDGIPQPCKTELDPSYSAHGEDEKISPTSSKESALPPELVSSSLELDLDASKRSVLSFLWTGRFLLVEAFVLSLKPGLRLCDVIISLNKKWKSDRILDPNIIFSSCYGFTRILSWAMVWLGEEGLTWIQKSKTFPEEDGEEAEEEPQQEPIESSSPGGNHANDLMQDSD